MVYPNTRCRQKYFMTTILRLLILNSWVWRQTYIFLCVLCVCHKCHNNYLIDVYVSVNMLIRAKYIAASKRLFDTKVMDTKHPSRSKSTTQAIGQEVYVFQRLLESPVIEWLNGIIEMNWQLMIYLRDEDMRRYSSSEPDAMPSHVRMSLNKIYRPTTPFQMWAYSERYKFILNINI